MWLLSVLTWNSLNSISCWSPVSLPSFSVFSFPLFSFPFLSVLFIPLSFPSFHSFLSHNGLFTTVLFYISFTSLWTQKLFFFTFFQHHGLTGKHFVNSYNFCETQATHKSSTWLEQWKSGLVTTKLRCNTCSRQHLVKTCCVMIWWVLCSSYTLCHSKGTLCAYGAFNVHGIVSEIHRTFFWDLIFCVSDMRAMVACVCYVVCHYSSV